MKSPGHDPLLLAGKVLVIFMQGVMAVAAVVIAIALPMALIFGAEFVRGLADGSGVPVDKAPMLAIAGLLLTVLAIVVALFVFFAKLRAIIDTVAEGDAFVPANADRLNLMAWLLLGTQILVIPAAGLGLLVTKWIDEGGHDSITIDAGLDLTGILMVLTLFILARVFRQGAAMRADLEGTV